MPSNPLRSKCSLAGDNIIQARFFYIHTCAILQTTIVLLKPFGKKLQTDMVTKNTERLKMCVCQQLMSKHGWFQYATLQTVTLIGNKIFLFYKIPYYDDIYILAQLSMWHAVWVCNEISVSTPSPKASICHLARWPRSSFIIVD